MKANYVHKDTLTATDYVELNKNNELLMSYNQALLKENKKQKEVIDKAIEWVRDWTDNKNDWFEEDSKPSELLDILKEVE